MCFADGSLAPAAPGAGTAGEQRHLTLTASDGNVLMAHECRTPAPTGKGVVVMPDVRGLHAYYRDLTVRLAEVGLESVAIDYFGRTAQDEDRSDAFEWMPHVKAGTPETMAADVQAGVDHLRSLGVTEVYTLGFCLGGMFSWRMSADVPGLAGCIGFYGRAAMVLPVIDQLQAPLLMLVAGADAHIPVEDPKQVADQATVPVELVVFDGMGHSFFDRTAPDNADACTRAWEHVLAFTAGR